MLRERTRLKSELTDLGLQVASGRRSLRESFSPKSLPELEYQTTPAATTYDNALTYAINKLKLTTFGVPTALGGRFDTYYWEKKLDPFYRDYRGRRRHMLVLLPDKSPSIAIKQIVENNRAWTLDCAYFVQVAHLYAVSQSDPHFDNRWAGKEFRLRVHFSSGAGVDQIKYFFRRETKSAHLGDQRSAHWMVTKDGKWQWERSNWGTPQFLTRCGRVVGSCGRTTT